MRMGVPLEVLVFNLAISLLSGGGSKAGIAPKKLLNSVRLRLAWP